MIKVLQVNANTKGYGGVSEIIFNIYKNIDKNQVQFDFLSPNKTTYELHKTEIENMGGKLYGLNINKNKIINKFLLSKRLRKFLKENKYDIIHINSGSYFFNLQVAIIAKKSHLKRIIVHSHNTLDAKHKIKNVLVKIFKPVLNLYATDFLACSQQAAKDMFTKKIAKEKSIIVKNGIDLKKFKFNEEIRRKVRKELNIDKELVIGNVGRLVEQKNQEFLIECFAEVYKMNKNSILVLIGEGELEKKLKEKTSMLGLTECVKFLGLRADVNEIMQAMDIFVLPSIFEGFGIVGLEAQAAGLFTLVSANVPEELKVTNNIKYLSLDRTAKEWANEILEKNISYDKEEAYKQVIKSGYNIKNTAEEMLKIYTRKK